MASHQGAEIGRAGRAEAAVAAAPVGRAERAAAAVDDRPQAGDALGHHHADGAAALAFQADRAGREVRLAVLQQGGDHFHHHVLVDRAAPDLQVHRHVLGDGGGFLQVVQVFRDAHRRFWHTRRRWRSCAAPGCRRPWRRCPGRSGICTPARTSLIRSASCGVVIEPSTRPMSYGPGLTARVASRK